MRVLAGMRSFINITVLEPATCDFASDSCNLRLNGLALPKSRVGTANLPGAYVRARASLLRSLKCSVACRWHFFADSYYMVSSNSLYITNPPAGYTRELREEGSVC